MHYRLLLLGCACSSCLANHTSALATPSHMTVVGSEYFLTVSTVCYAACVVSAVVRSDLSNLILMWYKCPTELSELNRELSTVLVSGSSTGAASACGA